MAHFRWIFARDARLCSGGEVRRVEAPLAEALPRLFVQGRIKEALLRVARYTRNGDANAMSTFARAWLVRPQPDPALDARAAAALAHAGDARQADRLRPALNRPDTVADRRAGAGGAQGRSLRAGAPPSQAGRSGRDHVRHARAAGGGRRAAGGLALRRDAR